MSIFIEAVEPKPRLFVFGAGYIGKPLVAMATACGFEVTVVDGRGRVGGVRRASPAPPCAARTPRTRRARSTSRPATTPAS